MKREVRSMKVGHTYFSSSRRNKVESLRLQMKETKATLLYKKDKNTCDIIANYLLKAAEKLEELENRSKDVTIFK